MRDESEIARELKSLATSWRVPPEPPMEAMWDKIEARAFTDSRGVAGRRLALVLRWLPAAAMLLIGIAIGRFTSPGNEAPDEFAGAVTEPDRTGQQSLVSYTDNRFVGIAGDYLEQVTALLITLMTADDQTRPVAYARNQANDLLAITRMLLDAPGAIDPELQYLLEDLELVLVQIARLPNSPGNADVYLIDQALDQREVLPRLRVLLASANDSRP